MIRVANSVEKNVVSDGTVPIAIPAGQSVEVLKDITGIPGEWMCRQIQNIGANNCYYAIGRNCDKTNLNGILANGGAVDANGFAAGAQLDISNCGKSVSVYSVSGTTVAITLLRRNDNAQGQGNIL